MKVSFCNHVAPGWKSLINHLIVSQPFEDATGNGRECDSSCCTAVILKKINNGTKKTLRKWGMGARGRGDPTALHLSEYHPITGEQSLRGELPRHSFLNELQGAQSDSCDFPRLAFSSELPLWVTRRYLQLVVNSLFSFISNNGNNQTLWLCSVFWFTKHFPYVMSFYSQSNPVDSQPGGRQCCGIWVPTNFRQQSILLKARLWNLKIWVAQTSSGSLSLTVKPQCSPLYKGDNSIVTMYSDKSGL